MVLKSLKRNRKLPATINRCLSSASSPGKSARGVQTYQTTLSNSLGYTDGWASSIWSMGTNLTFHNTGSSVGGDFGELNKLNYDYLIHFYDGRRHPESFTFLKMKGGIDGNSITCHFDQYKPAIDAGPEAGLDEETFACPQNDEVSEGQEISFKHILIDGCNYSGWYNAVWFTGSNSQESGSTGSYYLNSRLTHSGGPGCYQTSSAKFSTGLGEVGAFEFVVSGSVLPVTESTSDPGHFNDRWALRAGLQPSGTSYLAWSVNPGGCAAPCDTTTTNDFNDHTMVFSIEVGMTEAGYDPTKNPYYPDGAVGGGDTSGWTYSAWVSSSQPTAHSFISAHNGHNILRWSSEDGELNPKTDRFRIVRNWNPNLTASETWSTYDGTTNKGQLYGYKNINYQREILFQISKEGGCWTTFWKEDFNTLFLESGSKGLDGDPICRFHWDAHTALNQGYYAVVDFSSSREEPPPLTPLTETRKCSIGPMSMTKYKSNYVGSPPNWSASISYTYPAGFITNDSQPFYTSSAGIYKDYGLMWDVTAERTRLAAKGVVVDPRDFAGGAEPVRYPWFNSYEEYAQDVRSMMKDGTVFPEFNISEHVGNGYNLWNPNFSLWSLPGGEITSSKGNNGFNENFFKHYSNSDLLADFDQFQDQYEESHTTQLGVQTAITMSCEGILKLLPYEGFYPMSRTTQLSTKFIEALEPQLRLFEYDYNSQRFLQISPDVVNVSPELKAVRKQGIVTPFCAPGILYNSIRSGVGVGWTVVTGSCPTDAYYFQNVMSSSVSGGIEGNFYSGDFLNTVVYNKPEVAEKIPFEALYDLRQLRHGRSTDAPDSLNGAFHINYPETLQGYFPRDGTASIQYPECPQWGSLCAPTCSSGTMTPLNKLYMLAWDGGLNNDMNGYSLAMNNFLASTVRFFLTNLNPTPNPSLGDDGEINLFESQKVQDIVGNFQKGETYYMDVILERANSEFTMCESAFPRVREPRGETRGTYDSSFTSRDPNPRGTIGWRKIYPSWNSPPRSNLHPLFMGTSLNTADRIIRNAPASFDGRYFGPATRKYANLFNWATASEGAHYNVADPAQAPYTPPYYYGRSVARIEYTPGDEWLSTTTRNPIATFFSKMTMSFFNKGIEDMINETNLNFVAENSDWNSPQINTFTTSSFAYQMAQNVGDSINLKGLAQKTEETANQFGVVSAIRSTYDEAYSRWVISPKFESPILDFSLQAPQTMVVSGGLHPTQSISMSSQLVDADANPITHPGFLDRTPVGLGKGLWSGYGIQEDKSYVTLRLDFPNEKGDPATQDLREAFGFSQTNMSAKRLGVLSENRIISEAVVAIPFITVSNLATVFQEEARIAFNNIASAAGGVAPTPGARNFAKTVNPLDPNFARLSELLNAGRSPDNQIRLFEIDQTYFNELKTDPLAWKPYTQVCRLTQMMRRYVFPPEMDFVNRQDLLPFVMYTFPFRQTLEKIDLQDIWQGVLPRIGVRAEKGNEKIEHSLLNPKEFFHNKRLPPNIEWLVFKVKQRAEMNYTNVTTTHLDNFASALFGGGMSSDPANAAPGPVQASLNANMRPQTLYVPGEGNTPQLQQIPSENDVFSYNWPHDFYSLLELGKIKADIMWQNPRGARTPPAPPSTVPGNQGRAEPTVTLTEEQLRNLGFGAGFS